MQLSMCLCNKIYQMNEVTQKGADQTNLAVGKILADKLQHQLNSLGKVKKTHDFDADGLARSGR